MIFSMTDIKKSSFELGSVKGMTNEITFSFYDNKSHLCKNEIHVLFKKIT